MRCLIHNVVDRPTCEMSDSFGNVVMHGHEHDEQAIQALGAIDKL